MATKKAASKPAPVGVEPTPIESVMPEPAPAPSAVPPPAGVEWSPRMKALRRDLIAMGAREPMPGENLDDDQGAS